MYGMRFSRACGKELLAGLAVAAVVSVGCSAGGRAHLSAPAPQNLTEIYFCVVAAVNQMGYRIERADRDAVVVSARSLRPHGRTPSGDPRYDQLTISVAQEPSGNVVRVVATDRGHGRAVLERWAVEGRELE